MSSANYATLYILVLRTNDDDWISSDATIMMLYDASSDASLQILMYQALLKSIGVAKAVSWQGLYCLVCHCLPSSS